MDLSLCLAWHLTSFVSLRTLCEWTPLPHFQNFLSSFVLLVFYKQGASVEVKRSSRRVLVIVVTFERFIHFSTLEIHAVICTLDYFSLKNVLTNLAL